MIREAKENDSYTIAEMAVLMWEGHTIDELADGFSTLIKSQNAVIFLNYIQNTLIGFAQCQLRYDYVEGTHSSPVGYLEGIFVKEEYRKQGHAKELLTACEHWARKCYCTEFASDCELDNADSLHFHIKTGFQEANRIICFTKEI